MEPGQKPRGVVLIEDQRAFAEALGLALSLTKDLAVVGTAPEAELGLEVVHATRPDLVIVDYRLAGGQTGLDLARQLRSSEAVQRDGWLEKLRIVILTGYPAPPVAREAAQLRDVVVLSKNSAVTELVTAFRTVLDGGTVPSAQVDDPFGLTKAELEVLVLLSQGMNATQIAEHLVLSLHAIRARIKTTLRKLDVSSQLEAIAKAVSLELIVPPRSYDASH